MRRRWWVIGTVAVLVVAVTGVALAFSDRPAPPPATTYPASPGSTAPTPVAGRVLLGAYLGLSGTSQAEAAALRRRQLGRGERITHVYFAWTDAFPASFPAVPDGSVLMLSWRGTTYGEITDGSQDAFITANARQLAGYGRPLFLRWSWEMNGDWFAWCGARNGRDAAGYVAAWRHVHDLFTAAGVRNVAWVWAPNWNANPDEAWNAADRYYPGDSYVDWVGVDGFSAAGESADRLFTPVYDGYAARKPIMIAETGVVEGPGKVAWIDGFRAWVTSHPAVAAVVWFDTDTDTDSNRDWRIDTSDRALAAYRALAQDPRFSA